MMSAIWHLGVPKNCTSGTRNITAKIVTSISAPTWRMWRHQPATTLIHRVIALVLRVVVEDGLTYRNASWHLWRGHRVFVPFATIQNWVEAGGKRAG
jgi:hypothetical protein